MDIVPCPQEAHNQRGPDKYGAKLFRVEEAG